MKTTIFSFLLLIVSGFSLAQNEGIHIKISKKEKVDTTSIYVQCLEKYIDYHYKTLSIENKLYLLGDSSKYNLPKAIRGISIYYLDAFSLQKILKDEKKIEFIKVRTTYSMRHKNKRYMRRAIIIETIQGRYRLRILKHHRFPTKFKKNHGAWFYCKYNVERNEFTPLLHVIND